MSTKVFVGNLAFRTTDQALVEAFKQHGDVKSGVIITRGRRSLGYGFVEFANAEQASTAVEKMNRTEIFGRPIKVEVAKDPSERQLENPASEQGPARRRRTYTSDRNEKSANANTNTNTNTNANNNHEGNQSNSGNAEPRPNRKPRSNNKRRKNNRRNRGGPNNSNNNSNTYNNNNNKAPREAKPRVRPPREEKEKIPSKTTLFVANLPFSINDEQLLAAFNGAKAKSAHVVQTSSGRSRGYGFVEFENEADQLEALKNFNGKPIEGTSGNNNTPMTRNMSVSISHTPPPPPPAEAPAATS